MSRWEPEEVEALKEIRKRCQADISSVPPYPDLIGDRKLIRFLRGSNGKIELAAEMYSKFLEWYKTNNVAAIRHKILYEGCNHPFQFPLGELIIKLAPQIVIAPNALDNCGQPITLERFGFDPNEVFKFVTLEQYLVFLIYVLEYRSLILEQMSDVLEKKYEAEYPDPSTRFNGYGIILKTCTIRCLKGNVEM